MKKIIIISENDVSKYDLGAIKRNEHSPIYIWKNSDDERILLKLLRKYNHFIIINDEYLYETLELLKSEKPFSYYQFEVEFQKGEFYKKYFLRNNLGKYLYEALKKRG